MGNSLVCYFLLLQTLVLDLDAQCHLELDVLQNLDVKQDVSSGSEAVGRVERLSQSRMGNREERGSGSEGIRWTDLEGSSDLVCYLVQ